MLDEQQRAWVMQCAQRGDSEAMPTLAAYLLTVTLDEQECDVDTQALLRVTLARCCVDTALVGAVIHRTVVAMTDDIALLIALQVCCDAQGVALVLCRTPLALLAFRGALAWIADPACGSRSDWQTFVAEVQEAHSAGAEEATPLLLVWNCTGVQAIARRVEPQVLSVRTFAPSQGQALCAQVAMGCLLRRASYEG